MTKNEKQILHNSITDVADFPKKGIVFKDITTMLNDKVAYKTLMNILYKRYENLDIDYVVGLDARGFIFGGALAHRLNIGFVPIRKKGKLPQETISLKYSLEYGENELQIHKNAFKHKKAKVLIVDDLCATGGTAKAAYELIKKLDANLIEFCFVIDINLDNVKEQLSKLAPVFCVLDV